MITIQSPQKKGQKGGQQAAEDDAGSSSRRTKPSKPSKPAASFFAKKNLPPSSGIPSSSPAFATPTHPIKPFQPPVPAKPAILPIILPPATLRPLAFRTFTKKHNLTLTSTALQELASFIGRHCGSGWREEGLAEKVLEEVARCWKNRNLPVIVEGTSPELKDILKALEGNMSGGKIIPGPRGMSRQNSLMLESSQEADHTQTRLGLRPALLARDDSHSSLGMSGLDFSEEPDDETANDPRTWLKVIHAFDQPRYKYNVAKKHFEKETSKPTILPPAVHRTDAFRNRFNVIHQRLLRNEAFQTSAVTGTKGASRKDGAMQSHSITPISNLLGRHGSQHLLLGMLVVLSTGTLAVSDLSGAISLDLSHAIEASENPAWFTPGMIVLIDGVYEEEEDGAGGFLRGRGVSGGTGIGGTIDGRFQCFYIGQPPCEKRHVTLEVSGLDGVGATDHTIGGGFGWIDFLGVGSERAVGSRMRRLEHRILKQPLLADPDAPPGRGRIVILGELSLDQPRCLQALRKILGLYATDPPGTTPMTFILTGNFTTHAVMARGGSGGSIEYKEFFDSLASTLADYPTLLTTATFVFVPGDNDGWVSAFSGGAAVPLPRKPIPNMFTSRIRRVFSAANAEAGLSGPDAGGGEAIWTTNPSRLSLFGPVHEIVVFRDDLSARLRRASIRVKTKTSSSAPTEIPPGHEPDVAMSGAFPGSSPPEPEDEMDVDGHPTNNKIGTMQEVSYDVLAAQKLVKTVLDQGYLAPFRQPQRPVHWDYMGALHLYPLPTALVLVDTTAPPFCVKYEGCQVMNPGSLLVSGRKGVARWVDYEIGKGGKVRECTF